MKMSVATILGLAMFSAFAKGPASLEIPHVEGEVLVKVKPGQVNGLKAYGDIAKDMKLLSGHFVLLKSKTRSATSLVAALKSLPNVIYAEPNYKYSAIGADISRSPLDPMYGQLWGLKNTGSNEPAFTKGVEGADVAAEAAWEITKGSRKVVVAVIDTGVDYRHEDLKNNMWTNAGEIPGNNVDDDKNGYVDDVYGWNAVDNHGDPMDGNDHGTHCAGTIGAEHDNGVGVAGVMGEVSIMGVKFLDDSGSGTLDDAVTAIDYATKMNVDIMSNSWGGGGFSQALYDSITAAKNKGILFVAAAGNSASSNDSRPTYPSSYQVDNVISVASHTALDELSSFSCFGKTSVHVAAPGSKILSTVPNNSYAVLSGTSMATPHVSGVLGLLVAQNGRMPILEVKERLMATTVPVGAYRRTTASGGRVNAYNLLTDTRIPRSGPADSEWRTERIPTFETTHPYPDNASIKKTYRFPGARYVKVIIEKYQTEASYDFVTIRDGKGALVERVSGAGQNYETDYAESDEISIEFTSDGSVNSWGALIREVKVVY